MGDGTPTTFHEQRSLAERLYDAQEIDIKTIMARLPNQMARYQDDSGKDKGKMKV